MIKIGNLGWVVAAALFAVAVTSGFQGDMKIGVVDATRVFNESEYTKTQLAGLHALLQSRQDMLDFVDMTKTFTADQATKYHDLSTKPSPTAADKAELDSIKKTVQTANNRLQELQQKQPLSPTDKTELDDLSKRVQTTSETLARWKQDAQNELEAKKQDLNKLASDKVKDAIKQVASSQGYTLVFSEEVAVYGVNDLTDAVIKAVSK